MQTCVLHLIRNSFRYASKADWAALAKDLRPVYSAPTEAARTLGARRPRRQVGERYPAITKLWRNAWAEFVPFLSYSPEIRRVIYSSKRDREHARPLPPRRQSPRSLPDRAEMLVLTIRSLDPTGRGRQRWKPALNAFAVTSEGRIEINE